MNSPPRRKGADSPPAELLSASARGSFRRRLLSWYEHKRRDLPWRESPDAYRIWISEVMLQQTRVAAVLDHYQRFLVRFPNLQALAGASLQQVLAAWSGLGYYRRARALPAAARTVVARHGGELPRRAAELRQLPGFGPYTAAAVASIAFGQPLAVVDGNVERVLTRLCGWQQVRRQISWETAQQLLAPDRPGDFNQAMMELGATVCLPAQAQCGLCPVFRWCRTRGRVPATLRRRRRQTRVHYRLAQRGEAVWLVRRSQRQSLMPGMWELPQLPVNGMCPAGSWVLRHSITDTSFKVEVTRGDPPRGVGGRWIPRTHVERLPLTGLTKKILRRAGFI